MVTMGTLTHKKKSGEGDRQAISEMSWVHLLAANVGACGETRPKVRVHRARTISTITRTTTIVPAKP